MNEYLDRFFVGVVISWIGLIGSTISYRLFHTRLGFEKPTLSSVMKNSAVIGASTVLLTKFILTNKEGPKVEEPNE